MIYTCTNCGATSEKAHRLCSASREKPEDNFCGIPEEWICERKLAKVKYICESCGSASFSPDNLCRPEEKKG